MGLGIGDDRGQGEQMRDIAIRLAGQVERPEIGILTTFAGAPNRLADGSRASVVGRQGVQPVAGKSPVESLQVGDGSLRGGTYAASLVEPPVLSQPQHAAGGGHELPQSGGTVGGVDMGAKAALHRRQKGQLAGQPGGLDLADDVVNVWLCARQDGSQAPRRALQAADFLFDPRMPDPAEHEAVAQATPDLAIPRFRPRRHGVGGRDRLRPRMPGRPGTGRRGRCRIGPGRVAGAAAQDERSGDGQ